MDKLTMVDEQDRNKTYRNNFTSLFFKPIMPIMQTVPPASQNNSLK